MPRPSGRPGIDWNSMTISPPPVCPAAAHRVTLSAILALAACPILAGCGAKPLPPRPAAPMYAVRVGSHTVRCEIARTEPERNKGLMNRPHLDDDAGMLFLFPEERTARFYMRNTFIPLDIAYCKSDGTILEILGRKPLDETPIPSTEPVQYVLEVNARWCADHGVKAGDKIEIPDAVRRLGAE